MENYFVTTKEDGKPGKETHHLCFYENYTIIILLFHVYLGLTELRVLGRSFQLQSLQGAHRDDGVVGEQRLCPPGPVHHPREVRHCREKDNHEEQVSVFCCKHGS